MLELLQLVLRPRVHCYESLVDRIKNDTHWHSVYTATKLKGDGMRNPTNLEENLPFRRTKTVVQRTSAGQFTEPRTIAKLLL